MTRIRRVARDATLAVALALPLSPLVRLLAVTAYLSPTPAERNAPRHRYGVPALTLVRRYCVERGEAMPTRETVTRHRRSSLWD